MTRPDDACVLCGSETAETRLQLVEWTEPIAGNRYATIPRCVDRVACRKRVEHDVGEPWPVADRTPAPEPLARPAEPVAVAVAPPPDVEEKLPWER